MIRFLLSFVLVLHIRGDFNFIGCDPGSLCTEPTIVFGFDEEPTDWEQCNNASVGIGYDVTVKCVSTSLHLEIYAAGSGCTGTVVSPTWEFSAAATLELFNGSFGWAGNLGRNAYFDWGVASAPQPICSSSVGGDPIITYNGIEKKFTLPKIGMTTLLRTSEIVIQVSPIPGEKEDEQWIGKVLVSTTAGVVIANIRIRDDLESFGRVAKPSDDFETITVNAPWHEEQWLKLPNSTLVPYGPALLVRADIFTPTPTMQFKLARLRTVMEMGHAPFKQTAADVLRITPHNEVVIFETEEVAFSVSSVPALEYYWEDANDYRSLKFAHLDIDFIHIKQAKSCQGLLPSLWEVGPESTSQVAIHGDRQSAANVTRHLRKQILDALV